MKRWSCRYFLNLEKQKNKSVICFWKLLFGLLENRKKKKDSFFWISFSPEKLCDERRTTPFHFLNNYPQKISTKEKKKKKKKLLFLCCCCCCACAVSKKGPETFCHNLINPRAGTSKHCTV